MAATSKGEVAGSVLIWFLCAIAFLKVSQKIDSFMGSLGLNVGRTGGSLMADAMITMRAVTMAVGGGRRAGGRASSSGSGASGGANSGWFLKGGLAGVVSRHVTNSAAKAATGQTSAVHTAQSGVRQAVSTAVASADTSSGGSQADAVVNNDIHSGGIDIHTGSGVHGGAPLQDGIIVTGAGMSPGVSVVQDIHADDGDIGLQGSIPIGEPSAAGAAASGAEISQNAFITNDVHPGGDDLHATVSMPIETAPPQEGVVMTGGERHTNTQTASSSQSSTNSQTVSSTAERSHTTVNRSQHSHVTAPSLGGMIFSRSLAAGGGFANDVIGTVARGEVSGSITGDMAAQSLTSYMGYTAIRETARDVPVYSDVEIGRGRITGVETAAGGTEGLPFAMYHVGQYTAPQGEFQKVFTADGTQWYKQYAQDAVERTPYKAPDDTVAYHEKIVKKMPNPPRRKDRM